MMIYIARIKVFLKKYVHVLFFQYRYMVLFSASALKKRFIWPSKCASNFVTLTYTFYMYILLCVYAICMFDVMFGNYLNGLPVASSFYKMNSKIFIFYTYLLALCLAYHPRAQKSPVSFYIVSMSGVGV